MKTKIINYGTQSVKGRTQIIGDSSAQNADVFIGGLLQKGEMISGWFINEKVNVQSGEADIYIASKNGQKGIVKYYRGHIHPKREILEKLKGIEHTDIVKIYDMGEYKNHFYEIMEYAAGGALNYMNEDGSYKYLPLSEKDAIQVCREVIESFKICHEKGIIHRDVKPANIYYRNANGTDVVIGDFGISSVMDEDEILNHKTTSASRTTGYAAPEVLSGIISPKMDYYALGITLWEILTGKDPFVMKNSKRRNEAHLIRDTIEGRIADDLLCREPQLSDSMQHLIRGLLVVDEEKRWGYDEVIRHLNGEYVEVVQKEVKAWSFKVAGENCATLEEIGNAISANIESAEVRKTVYRGFVSSFLEDKYPEIARKIGDVAEENNANGTLKLGMREIIWILNPKAPYITKNGYKAENIEDIENLLQNVPEEMIIELQDKETVFYKYLSHIGYEDKIAEIKNIAKEIASVSDYGKLKCLSQIILMLKNYIIKPFSFGKYGDYELSEIDQLERLPAELSEYTVNIISTKSLEGQLYTWIEKKIEVIDVDSIKTYNDLKDAITRAKIWSQSKKTKTKELSAKQKNKFSEAERLFYDEGETDKSLQIIESLYKYDEYNQDVLYLYICLLNKLDINKAKQFITSRGYKSLGVNVFMIFNFIANNNFKMAKMYIENSLSQWPGSFLLKCQRIIFDIRKYKMTKNQSLLKEADKISQSLGKPRSYLELSWQVKLLDEISALKGNAPSKFDKKTCKEFYLYYKILNASTLDEVLFIYTNPKQAIRFALTYIDNLLDEELPKEKIIEFAKSKEYIIYKKLLSAVENFSTDESAFLSVETKQDMKIILPYIDKLFESLPEPIKNEFYNSYEFSMYKTVLSKSVNLRKYV